MSRSKTGMFDMIGGIIADAGKYVVDGLGNLAELGLGKVLTPVLIAVGVAVGVAVVVGASILIARVVKKKKNLQLNGGRAPHIQRLGRMM